MKELQSWHEEQRSAHLYRLLAELEAGTARSRLFSELAREADEQSRIWAQAAQKKGSAVPAFRLDMRTRAILAASSTMMSAPMAG